MYGNPRGRHTRRFSLCSHLRYLRYPYEIWGRISSTHLTGERTAASGGYVTCPRCHSQGAVTKCRGLIQGYVTRTPCLLQGF